MTYKKFRKYQNISSWCFKILKISFPELKISLGNNKIKCFLKNPQSNREEIFEDIK